MLSSDYKIIAVDNDQEELDRIEECFKDLRIACFPLLYSSGDELKSKFKGIRLAFFDVNLSAGNPTNDPMLCSIISDALKKILAYDNGPYALIFWSLHASKLDIIKRYIETREKGNIPSPLLVDTIDKVRFTDTDDFKRELERILSHQTLNLIFDYENKAMQAASRTINTLFDLVPRGNDSWGESVDFETNFDKVFSKIAVEATGKKYATDNPKLSIQEGLSPILVHNLHNQLLTTDWDVKLTQISTAEFPANFNRGVLNSAYHIDTVGAYGKDTRGAVVKSELGEDYRRFLGENEQTIKNSMFKFKWDNPSAAQQGQITGILSKCDLVLLEISAACDYAQNNSRIYKYILGIECPVDIEEVIQKKDGDYLYTTPHFFLNDEKQFILKFNFRYIVGLHPSDDRLGAVMYRLNNNIIDLIGNKYSSYVSRIGTVAF